VDPEAADVPDVEGAGLVADAPPGADAVRAVVARVALGLGVRDCSPELSSDSDSSAWRRAARRALGVAGALGLGGDFLPFFGMVAAGMRGILLDSARLSHAEKPSPLLSGLRRDLAGAGLRWPLRWASPMPGHVEVDVLVVGHLVGADVLRM